MRKCCKNCAHCRAREAFPGHIVHDCLVRDNTTNLACVCEHWDEKGASVLEGVKWEQYAEGDKEAEDAHARSLWEPKPPKLAREVPILDACCGGKMMWVDKDDPEIIGMDIREERVTFTDRGEERVLDIQPDIQGDFTRTEFADGTFDLIVFDPPHLLRAGENSWLFKKYGKLEKDTWKEYMTQAFRELDRILAHRGTLIFKWNTCQISKKDIEACFTRSPKFVTSVLKTYTYIFYKP